MSLEHAWVEKKIMDTCEQMMRFHCGPFGMAFSMTLLGTRRRMGET